MRTDIYLHLDNSICAIVDAEEGRKFVDDIQTFCPDCFCLLCEAKNGFNGFPFYDRYRCKDVCFTDLYGDIVNGCDGHYTYLGSVFDGVIDFDSKLLEDKGDYFRPLYIAMKIAEEHCCPDIRDIVFSEDYIVLSSLTQVLAYSNVKVPFQPNAEQKNFRKLIREKLSTFRSQGQQTLYAEYGCVNSPNEDVENMLFYNMGTAAFRTVVGKDTCVCFQRMPQTDVFNGVTTGYQYFYHYYLWSGDNQNIEWENELICEWQDIPIGKINSATKPFAFFSAIRHSPERVSCYRKGYDAHFDLHIRLYIPAGEQFINVVSVMKPMIDGVICAFHSPKLNDGDGRKFLDVEGISKLLKSDTALFSSKAFDCLGERCFVRAYRNSVKWDPQDDRLAHVVIEPILYDGKTFAFSGKIFSVL